MSLFKKQNTLGYNTIPDDNSNSHGDVPLVTGIISPTTTIVRRSKLTTVLSLSVIVAGILLVAAAAVVLHGTPYDHSWSIANDSATVVTEKTSEESVDLNWNWQQQNNVAAKKLIRCAKKPESRGCSFPKPPDVFDVHVKFGKDDVIFRITTAWSPPYATLFYQLVSLGYFDNSPLFRVDYRNASQAFMAQSGWNLLPGVQEAWDTHRAINISTPAIESNTQGRITMGMNSVVCNPSATSPKGDPCTPYRPACTDEDYCAFGGATQFFINYGNNSRLDPHGFAPFGEVVKGMETIERLGFLLGNTYGEMQDFCPVRRQKPAADVSPYCVYNKSGNKCQGISNDELEKETAGQYIALHFPLMHATRVRAAKILP